MEHVAQDKMRQRVLIAQATRAAIVEVIAENREDIIRRARAKLVALGVTFTEEELNAQIS
jgi:hypothetical protein